MKSTKSDDKKKSKSKYTVLTKPNSDEKQFKDKIWTQTEQRKYLQKLSSMFPQIEEEPKATIGIVEDHGNYLDLSWTGLKILNTKVINEQIPLDTLNYSFPSLTCQIMSTLTSPAKVGSLNGFYSSVHSLNLNKLLYLSNNNLESIPSELFALCPNLFWIDLRKNNLKTFPTSVVNHLSLETILLQKNNLKILPLELGSLPKLRTLSVHENPLEFPNKTILTQCSSDANLIDYLKRCWDNQSTKDVPILKEKSSNSLKKKPNLKVSKVKNLRTLSEIVCEKKDSSKIIEQVVAEKITSELRSQEKTIQKVKDKETLKTWRDRKKRMERDGCLKISKPPPFGVDPNAKMPSRRDLALDLKIDMKDKPKRGSKDHVNLGQEIEELRKTLQGMVKKRQTDDPSKEMNTRINEIKAIKEIQKKLSALKKIN